MRKIKIILGSGSAVKFDAVSAACRSCFNQTHYDLSGDSVRSGQAEQPIGLSAMYNGALARAKGAAKVHSDAIAIGIENGITVSLDENVFIDLAVIVVLTRTRKIVTTSQGIEIPGEFVDKTEKRGFGKTTVGQIIAEELGGDPADPHKTLLEGKSSREKILEEAVLLALNQLKPSDFYLE